MLGQNNHFSVYAPEKIPYAIKRYKDETHRLFRVLDTVSSSGKEFVAGDYSIADIAIFGWANRHERHEIDLADYPNVERWYNALLARPAVERGLASAAEPQPGTCGLSAYLAVTRRHSCSRQSTT